ncbi:MAG: CDP-alcohol phosphatidyltransferase family protein [Treponema sp.]|jgi:CDP-diacylglycerol--serine O-phosphatidyltransferase|nr:CDP-alcohol phosphatidyltransferase family protein [Treponema sp.]
MTKKRLTYIAVLPTAVTLINAFCGFLSIVYASRGTGVFLKSFLLIKAETSFFAMAGYMVILAMLADILDGQVARWSGTASSFGGQLDSLADVLSFGAAPAFLMFKVMEARLGLEAAARNFFFPLSLWKAFPKSVSPQLAHLAGRWTLFVAIIFLLCAVIRLARFNVENDEDMASHQFFAGLPSPAAAGVVVSMVIFQEDFLTGLTRRLPGLASSLTDVTNWLFPFAVLGCGILMVSRVRYVHLANKILHGKKNFTTALLVLFTVFLAVWKLELALILGFWGFAATGLVRAAAGLFKRKNRPKNGVSPKPAA